MLLMSIGIMNGESRPGPRSSKILCCSAVVCSPPMPEPRMTPISSRFSFSRSRPESLSADQRHKRRIANSGRCGGFPWATETPASGSKFFTSPAIFVSNAVASNAVMWSMPHWPAIKFFQKVSRSWPSGVTTPRPVTTTRRSVRLFAIKIKRGSPSCVQPSCPEKFDVATIFGSLRCIWSRRRRSGAFRPARPALRCQIPPPAP